MWPDKFGYSDNTLTVLRPRVQLFYRGINGQVNKIKKTDTKSLRSKIWGKSWGKLAPKGIIDIMPTAFVSSNIHPHKTVKQTIKYFG